MINDLPKNDPYFTTVYDGGDDDLDLDFLNDEPKELPEHDYKAEMKSPYYVGKA